MSSKKSSTSITSTRNLRNCPEKLGMLIDTINLLPPDLSLHSLNIGSQDLIFNEKLHLEALQGLKDKLEELSHDFQKYIYGREIAKDNIKFFYTSFLPDLDFHETCDAIKRYEEYSENRFLLIGLIKNFSSSKNKYSRQLPYLIHPRTRINVDIEGRIHFSFDEFIDALQNVEISRLKLCENCNKVFWQGRNTQKGCNTNCANNIRVKRSRELKRKKRIEYEFNSIKKARKKDK